MSQLTAALNADSWHKAKPADAGDDRDKHCYGLGSDLYDKISASPEVDSGHKCFKQFLTHLESDLICMFQSL
jgi:hypothetical protein